MFKKITALTVAILMLCTCIPTLAATDLTINTEIDYNTKTVTISGALTGSGNWVTAYVEGPNNRLEYIGSTDVKNNGKYEITFGLKNPVPDGEYRVTVKAEGMTSAITTMFVYETRGACLTLQLSQGATYNVTVTGKNISDLNNQVFNLCYDTTKLKAINLCSFTTAENKVVGAVAGTDIIITEYDSINGVISFRLDRNYNDKLWSGLVNSVKFESLVNSGTTIVEISVQ